MQVTKSGANGVTTTYAYDGAQRLAAQSSQPDADVALSHEALGRRVAKSDTVGVTNGQFDRAGDAPFGR